MKVIVFPHDLEMGGSQLNAIEIAAAVRDLGVEATIFGRRGALNARIDALGLDFVEAPPPRARPTPSLVAALRRTAQHRGANVLHGYEWPPALECYLASTGRRATVAVSTVMSMAVAPFVPKTMPLLVGTEQIAHTEQRGGRQNVEVLEPPVDLGHNTPVAAPVVAAFRHGYGVDPQDFLLVCVGRLARELKAEGLLTAITAVGELPATWRVHLLVVGDGPARGDVEGAAAAANRRAGRTVVTLTGELMDPRPAYAAADAVLGMGGSALRALAYSKPLIVQGERGFFSLLDEASAATFLWQGWYGVGRSASEGSGAFSTIVSRLVSDAALREEVSAFGHDLVEDRFSLAGAARRQVRFYEEALEGRPSTGRIVLGSGRVLPALTRYTIGRRIRRAAGRGASDDFNNKPVAASGGLRPGLPGGCPAAALDGDRLPAGRPAPSEVE